MLLKKGIVRRTFFFSAMLVLCVTLIAFAVMYFIMPGYYLTQKERTLKNNIDELTSRLRQATTQEQCAALISEFSEANNVNVLSFDKDERMMPAMSTPFLGMRGEFFIAEQRRMDADGEEYYTIRMQEVPPGSPSGHIRREIGGDISVKLAARGRDIISLVGKVGTDIVDSVNVSGTLQPIGEARGVILSLIPYVLAIAVALGLLLSGIYARQITKPILQISDAALKMQQMEPDVSSGIRTNDELGQLSANMDVLYAKLRENIEHLKAEMEKVASLERSKTEMMQSASHELKTPIAALSGMLEGMLDNIGVYKDKEKYLAECKEQVDKLSLLVAEILYASKADAAGEGLELIETYVDELVRRTIAENAYQIHEKDLRIGQRLPPAVLLTDPDILYRVISNLFSNAVRYTPQNGEIRVSITEDETGRHLIIENQCDPIPKEELPKLFEAFYTRSYSRDKTQSGTGLGLYIVKRSLERLEIPYEAKATKLGFLISLTISR